MRSVGKWTQGRVVKGISAFHRLQPDFPSVGASSYRIFCLTEEPLRFETGGIEDMPGYARAFIERKTHDA